jgi:hypothetical protein
VSANDCPERDPCDWVLECLPEPSSGSEGSKGAAAAPSAAAGAAAAPLPRKVQPGGSAPDGGVQPPPAEQQQQQQQWVVLDEQRGVSFAQRHQLRSFPIAAAARAPSRRFRLRVTRTRDPAAATCVQLACLNLYAAPEPAPAVEDLAAGLRAGAGSGGAALERRQLEVLAKVLGNVAAQPGEARWRRIRQVKVSALAAHEGAAALLAAAGFRPLLCAAEGGGAGAQEVVLLADARAEWAEAAGRAAKLLLAAE